MTLQISLAPPDLRHAEHVLPHQLRQWAGQVREVLCVVDLQPSRGQFAPGWREQAPRLLELVDQCCAGHANARRVEVDYSAAAERSVSEQFLGGAPVPAKDYRGGPYYSYLFGLTAAEDDYVFHVDSDMLFGGGSQTWTREAVDLLRERGDVLCASVLPGPPTEDGSLRTQTAPREAHHSVAYRFETFTTRHFLLDRRRFADRVGSLAVEPAPLAGRTRAWLHGNPPFELPEQLFTRALADRGLGRVSFLGREPGMWSLHPPYRNEAFYRLLPELVRRVEAGDVPEAQRGDYDVNPSLVDWASARLISVRARRFASGIATRRA